MRLESKMGFCGRSLCFCLLFVCGTNTEKPDAVTTCRSEPVAEGETAVMNISLRPQIDLKSRNIFIYLRREPDPADTLRCDQREPGLPLKCYTVNGSRFQTEGLIDHDLNLIVPNMTDDLAGEYVLRVYINDVPDPDTNCALSIITGTGSFAASEENNSDVTPIVVPIFVILVIIISIIAIVIFWRRRRKKKDDQEQHVETQAMNPGDRDGIIEVPETGKTSTTTEEVNTGTYTDTAPPTTPSASLDATADNTTTPTNAQATENRLLAARIKKPLRERTTETDKNTPIGTNLQKAIQTNKNDFSKMKVNKRGRPDKIAEDKFVTAKGSQMK